MGTIKKILLSATVCILTMPITVAAATDGFANPLKGSNLTTVAGFTEAFLRAVVFIMFPIAVVFIVYSGFLFIAAQGNPEGLKKAKMNFLWTVIGVTLLLGAWALSLLIKGTLDPLLN